MHSNRLYFIVRVTFCLYIYAFPVSTLIRHGFAVPPSPWKGEGFGANLTGPALCLPPTGGRCVPVARDYRTTEPTGETGGAKRRMRGRKGGAGRVPVARDHRTAEPAGETFGPRLAGLCLYWSGF